MPCSRATFVGDAPGARLCAAIVCFCSVVQRRRRSPRGIKSIRRFGALLRLVVCALSVETAVSAGVASVSIAGDPAYSTLEKPGGGRATLSLSPAGTRQLCLAHPFLHPGLM